MSKPQFAAFEEDRLRPTLYRFILGRLRDAATSEDIVQETYLRLYDYRSAKPVSDVGAFCFAVARNLIRDHARRRRSMPVAPLTEDVPCSAPRADEVIAHRQRVEVFKRALHAMPPLRREVFTRRRLDGQSPGEIAADLGLSTAAVEKHLVRAVADLHLAMDRPRTRTRGSRP